MFYVHLVYFVVNWYISPCFGILYKEKSGTPGLHTIFLLLAKKVHRNSAQDNQVTEAAAFQKCGFLPLFTTSGCTFRKQACQQQIASTYIHVFLYYNDE
jgi:hypothetical protein